MFRTRFLSIIRSVVLYAQQQVYVIQYQTPDDGQKSCPKHVELYSKNKFEKLVHIVGFIIRIRHDARSPECQIRQINPLKAKINLNYIKDAVRTLLTTHASSMNSQEKKRIRNYKSVHKIHTKSVFKFSDNYVPHLLKQNEPSLQLLLYQYYILTYSMQQSPS